MEGIILVSTPRFRPLWLGFRWQWTTQQQVKESNKQKMRHTARGSERVTAIYVVTEINCTERTLPKHYHFNKNSCPSARVGAKCSIECEIGYRFTSETELRNVQCKLTSTNRIKAEWNLRGVVGCRGRKYRHTNNPIKELNLERHSHEASWNILFPHRNFM